MPLKEKNKELLNNKKTALEIYKQKFKRMLTILYKLINVKNKVLIKYKSKDLKMLKLSNKNIIPLLLISNSNYLLKLLASIHLFNINYSNEFLNNKVFYSTIIQYK